MDIKGPPRRRGRKTQKVTLKEVADAAGVSMMTVSNVINGRFNVGADLRALIQEKIEELGYTPNRAAQQLAGAARPHIGLIYTGVTNSFIASVIVGTMKAASRLQLDISVELGTLDDPKALRNIMQRMEETGIDGFLLPSPIAEFVAPTFKKKPLDVPAVAIAPGFPIAGMATVRGDERKASHELVTILLERGHKNIGHLAGPASQTGSIARLNGYKDALQQRGLEPRPEWIVVTEFNFQEGVKAAERLLGQEPELTAIFAANDTLAASALAVAHNRGISVPEKLSIVGYDDSPVAEQAWPGLTTIHQDALIMTERAVELLASAIQQWKVNRDEYVDEDIVVPYQVVVRGSVAEASHVKEVRPRKSK